MERTKIYYLHKGDNVPFYVGKTKNEYFRLIHHKKTFGNEIHMKIISEVIDWKRWEKYYIQKFKNQGFILQNKNKGGGGPEFVSEQTKQKLSNNKKRAKKISKARLGKPMPHKGKPFSEEHKQRIKQTRGFLKNRKNTWQITPVLQYDLQGNFIKEWESQTEATKSLGKTGDGVGACCRERQKSAYGYIWKFKK